MLHEILRKLRRKEEDLNNELQYRSGNTDKIGQLREEIKQLYARLGVKC